MKRAVLNDDKVEARALAQINSYHTNVVKNVADAVASNRIVVVGMAGNPFVRKVKSALDAQGISYKYLEYGSYLSKWKQRLAIKLWSGWPTFPQVFVDGNLVGGANDTIKLIEEKKIVR
jgi:monothiol glutaredoxin